MSMWAQRNEPVHTSCGFVCYCSAACQLKHSPFNKVACNLASACTRDVANLKLEALDEELAAIDAEAQERGWV